MRSGHPSGLLLLLAISMLAGALAPHGFAQGVAVSNRQAQPKKPLPEGMKAPKVEYRDLAKEAGLTGVNVSGAEMGKQYIVESTGNGMAVLDYDNDGLMDILFVSADRFPPNNGKARHYLYRNKGGLRFEDVTEKAGLRHNGWAQGVCAGDVDNDGYTDLMIPHWGQNTLFRNKGDGTFADETAQRGFVIKREKGPPMRWSSGCAFLDYDRDGDLDLFIANYLEFDPAKTPKPGEGAECRWKGIPVLCGPRGLPGETMSIFQNDGKGVFQDVSAKAGVGGDKNYYGFTPLIADLDNDGWIDVYVACDSTASLLYRNKGDGTFEEMGVISGTAYNMDGMEQAGMGATAADYDGDGDLDIFKTNFSNDTHTLYRNDGDFFFQDETVPTGLAVNTQYLGWGTAFLDFDHDGWKDIFVANGHVYPDVDNAEINERFRQQRLLYWNRGDGQFYDISSEAGPGILAHHASRGIAPADLDNDGTLEIVIVNMHESPSLLKNFGPKANSLLIEAQTPAGRAAVGARLTVAAEGRTQIDEVRSGGYHISQGDFRVHFGIGSAAKADITVRWPDGKIETVDSYKDVAANQWIVIRQGKGITAKHPFAPAKKLTQKTAEPAAEGKQVAAGSSKTSSQ